MTKRSPVRRMSVAIGVSVLAVLLFTACSATTSAATRTGSGAGKSATPRAIASCDPGAPSATKAATRLYWANNGIKKGAALEATDHRIGSSNLDGSDVTQSLLSNLSWPNGVAVAGSYLYWTDTETNTIGRAKVDGSEADDRFIAKGAHFPVSLTVYGKCIYWTNNGTSTISSANLDGTGVNEKFIELNSGIQMPNAIAISGQYVYWTNVAGSIGRAKIDGSDPNGAFINNTGDQSSDVLSPLPVGLAVDDKYIYWPDMQDNTIARANLDGTGVDKHFIDGADFPGGLAIDGTYVYWTNNDGTIGRANLDGSGAKQQFIVGGNSPAGLAVG